MKKLFVNASSLSGIYAIGNIAQQALAVILIPLYTSYLNPKDFGVIALMGITVAVITEVVITPIISALGRYYYKPDYKDKNSTLLFNLFCLLVIKTVIVTILYWSLSEYLCSLLFDDELIYVVKVFTIVVLFTPVQTFLLYLVRLLEMAKYFVFLSLCNMILQYGLIIYLLIKTNAGLLALVYGNIFNLCFMSVMSIPILLKYSRFKISASIIKDPLKFGYLMLPSGYAGYLMKIGDRYILRVFSSVATVGLYSFGNRIASVMEMMLVTPLSEGTSPTIRKLEANPVEQKHFLRNVANYSYLISIFAALAISLFSKEIIMLLARNKEFWPCWVIIPILSFSKAQHCLSIFLGWGMSMRNKAYHISGILLVSAAVNICLNIIFIPYWGIMGAAFATLISYVVWNGLKIYYSAKFYDLYFDLKRLGFVTIVGVGLYLMSLFIANIGYTYINITLKFLILIAYPITFFITGFFSLKEKEYIQKLWTSIRVNGLRETYAKIKAF